MSPPARSWLPALALLALAGYAWFLGRHLAVVAAGADSSGYLNSARLLAAGELRTPLRVPPEFGPATAATLGHFMPGGFRPVPDSLDLVPTYPTGLPLHFAAGARLLGWTAGPFIVQLLAAVGAIWLCYLTARQLGLGPPLAATGAALLAAFPVFLFTSLQALSDTPATTWALASLYCALRARARPRWAAAAGLAFALGVLVRPTNAVLLPAVLVLLGRDPRRLGLLLLGGLPGAGWFLVYNQLQYGGPLRSGYGDGFEAFAWAMGPRTAAHFARWLAAFLPPVALVLPLLACRSPAASRPVVVALGLFVAANFGVYLFYDVSHDVWWCLRFILPGVAALILLALLGLEALAAGPGARWPRAFRPVAAGLLIGWASANSWYWTRHLHILLVPTYEKAYAAAARLVREHVPARGVVLCSDFSGTVYFYTPLPTLIWDPLTPDDFARYAGLARSAGRPLFALLFVRDQDEILGRRCPGTWAPIATTGAVALWELRGMPPTAAAP